MARAYYAAFYAVTAALHEQNRAARTHKGTHHLFHQLYVTTGRLDRRYSLVLTQLFQDRQDADYVFEAGVFSAETATQALDDATDFVATVTAMLA